jgi:tetratricopeptide (TPR) repeat protein
VKSRVLRRTIRKNIAEATTHDIVDLLRKKATQALPVDDLCEVAYGLSQHARHCESCSGQQRQADRRVALMLYEYVSEHDPGNEKALVAKAWMKPGSDFPARMKSLIRRTGSKQLNAHIGHYFLKHRRYDLAEKYYRLALPHIRRHYGIMYALAKLYEGEGSTAKSRTYARLALNRLKKMPDSYREDPVTRLFKAELDLMTNRPSLADRPTPRR